MKWHQGLGLREAGVYYALAAMMAGLTLYTVSTGRPAYLSYQNVINILYQSSLVAIMGVAMTVVLIVGNFDLSVASVAALAGTVLIGCSSAVGFWPAVVIAIAVAGLVGVFNGLVVEFVGINAFIVTLGTLTAIRGLILVITNGRALSFGDADSIISMASLEGGRVPLQLPVVLIGAALIAVAGTLLFRERASGRVTPPRRVVSWAIGGVACLAIGLFAGPTSNVPKPVAYLIGLTAVVWFVLTCTTFGRRIFAVGGNAEAARLSGINVTGYKVASFVFCSLVAGFAGTLFASRLGAINPSALQGTELTVIAAAILGGTSLFGGAGSVIKTLAGAFLLYMLNNGFNVLNLGANYQGLIEGAVVIIAAAVYTVGSKGR